MAIPDKSELLTLNRGFRGGPFARVAAKQGTEFNGLEVAFRGQAFAGAATESSPPPAPTTYFSSFGAAQSTTQPDTDTRVLEHGEVRIDRNNNKRIIEDGTGIVPGEVLLSENFEADPPYALPLTYWREQWDGTADVEYPDAEPWVRTTKWHTAGTHSLQTPDMDTALGVNTNGEVKARGTLEVPSLCQFSFDWRISEKWSCVLQFRWTRQSDQRTVYYSIYEVTVKSLSITFEPGTYELEWRFYRNTGYSSPGDGTAAITNLRLVRI